MLIPSDIPLPRELAVRENDGITVRLAWDAADDTVLLGVDDAKLGLRYELPVPAAEAWHAFQHPFAYIDDSRSCGRATSRYATPTTAIDASTDGAAQTW